VRSTYLLQCNMHKRTSRVLCVEPLAVHALLRDWRLCLLIPVVPIVRQTIELQPRYFAAAAFRRLSKQPRLQFLNAAKTKWCSHFSGYYSRDDQLLIHGNETPREWLTLSIRPKIAIRRASNELAPVRQTETDRREFAPRRSPLRSHRPTRRRRVGPEHATGCR
jgi:hypothetical protein